MSWTRKYIPPPISPSLVFLHTHTHTSWDAAQVARYLKILSWGEIRVEERGMRVRERKWGDGMEGGGKRKRGSKFGRDV